MIVSKVKRFASTLLIAVLLSMTFVVEAHADEMKGSTKAEAVASAAALLQAVAGTPNYQEMFEMPDVDLDALELGDPIPVYAEEAGVFAQCDIFCWPIFSRGEVVATMVEMPDVDGERLYRLSLADVESLQSVVNVSGSYAMVCREDDPAEIVSEQGSSGSASVLLNTVSVQGNRIKSRDADSSLPEDSEKFVSFWPQANLEYIVDDAAVSRITAASASLSVPKINKSMSNLCWAASAQCIGSYLTKHNIADWTIASRIKGGNYAGTLDDAMRGLALFTYSSSSTAIASSRVSFPVSDADVRNWINSGIPLYAHLTNPAGGGHAVVICGYSLASNGNQVLTIMDPDIGAYEAMTRNTSGNYSSSQHKCVWNVGTVRMVNWQKPYGGSSWSYMNTNGTKTIGWRQIGGWYYFNSSGYMLTGWQWIGGAWYYLQDSGEAATGWHFIDGYWYAFDSSCAMRKGWFKDGSSWYYLRTATNTPGSGPEGSMLANGTWTIDGKAYRFNSSGVCLNP